MRMRESVVIGPSGVGYLAGFGAAMALQAIARPDQFPLGWAGYALTLAVVAVVAYRMAFLLAERMLPADGLEMPQRVWQPVVAALVVLAVAALIFIVAFTAGLPAA